MTTETKTAKFERLATTRAANAEKAIKLMRNLIRSEYESTEARRAEILEGIEGEIRALREAWHMEIEEAADPYPGDPSIWADDRKPLAVVAPSEIYGETAPDPAPALEPVMDEPSASIARMIETYRSLPIAHVIDVVAAAGAVLAERRK